MLHFMGMLPGSSITGKFAKMDPKFYLFFCIFLAWACLVIKNKNNNLIDF